MYRGVLAGIICLVVSLSCSPAPQAQSDDSPAGADNRAPQQLAEKKIGKVVLQPQTVLKDKLSLLLPEGFTPMDDQMLKIKYPNQKAPSLVYSNENGTVNIAINHTQDRLLPSQLAELHRKMDPAIRQQYPSATWQFSGFQHHHGREWCQLEFQSPAIDTTIHNMMVATSVDNRMLLVSFNVTDELAADWLEPGREIIKSLQVKD